MDIKTHWYYDQILYIMVYGLHTTWVFPPVCHKITFRLLISSCHCIFREYFLSICVFNKTHFYKTIFSPWLVQPWMRSLWQLPNIKFHGNSLQFHLPVFVFKVNHTASVRTIIWQHRAERPKEENHNQGFSRLIKSSSEVCHSQAQPHWGSFRKPWMPALLLNSESTRAETVYFIYHDDQPWKKFPQILRE